MPYADSAGVRIYYEVEGEGFPILLHTGGGGDGEMWQRAGYVEGLRSYRRILMDHRGHGRSERPTDIDAHRIERYVDDVLAVLDAAAAPRAAFWGYSDGGNVGFALAAWHPERTAALLTTGTSLAENWPAARSREVEEWREALRGGIAGLNDLLEQDEPGAIPEWFKRQMADTDPQMFLLEIAGWATWSGPLLSGLRMPVLMLVGEREDPDKRVAQAVAMHPNARCVTFAGLGHVAAFVRSELALPHALSLLHDVAGT